VTNSVIVCKWRETDDEFCVFSEVQTVSGIANSAVSLKVWFM